MNHWLAGSSVEPLRNNITSALCLWPKPGQFSRTVNREPSTESSLSQGSSCTAARTHLKAARVTSGGAATGGLWLTVDRRHEDRSRHKLVATKLQERGSSALLIVRRDFLRNHLHHVHL